MKQSCISTTRATCYRAASPMIRVRYDLLASAGVDRQYEHEQSGRLGLSDAEEDALVLFMQTLTDGFMH